MTDFDTKARTWDSDPGKLERAQRVADAIRAAITLAPSASVLEYGCGTGLLGFALQPYVGRLTLADTSSEMLAVLRDKIAASGARNMAPIELDLVNGPLPDARYDMVCTLLALHHIPDTSAIVGKFHDVLVPGGMVCISDLDTEDGSYHGRGFTGHNGFDRAALGRILERAGFRNVRFTTPHRITRETEGGTRVFPLFLAIADRP